MTGRRCARPAGTAPGAVSFVGAWAVIFAIGRLTGSAAVALLLVAGAVAMSATFASGWVRLRDVDAVAGRGPRRTQVGSPWALRVDVLDRVPRSAAIHLSLSPLDRPRTVSTAVVDRTGTAALEFELDDADAGTITEFHGWIAALGAGGLVWWRRRVVVGTDPIEVAPRSSWPILPVDRRPATDDGRHHPGSGFRDGDVQGVRPWRDGESNQTIHWPSTVRAREFVASDRDASVDTRWSVPLDSDPGRLRSTLEEALRHGHDVEVTAPELTPPTAVRDRHDAAHWATVAADRARATRAPGGEGRVRRTRHPRISAMEPVTMTPAARWWAAVAAAISLVMLLGALDHGTTTRLLAVAGVVVGAAFSVRIRDGVAPLPARMVVSLLALGALVRIAVQASGIGGLIEALRGPMPDLLVVLLALHGAETVNRRTVRVHLAITSVVAAYAAGLRIDGEVGWWLLAWGTAVIASSVALTAAPRLPRAPGGTSRLRAAVTIGSAPRSVGWIVLGAVVVTAAASLVTVPAGPVDLGLPALTDDDAVIDRPGRLAGPDGDPIDDPIGDPQRGALGTVGGYRGFSETLDTSVRGGLGDEVVMRVRAPEPAFWRGQTFSDFDGRTWRVSGDDGQFARGPRIDVPPTLGDLAFDAVATEEFRQTFHVDADLPNLVFAAARPSTLVFDGGVHLRPDGALRADRTLTEGSIYTVVSQRTQVTEELLRGQGDLADWFGPATGAGGDPRLDPLLALPESMTQRTLDLADQLRVPGSTYDTILAYQDWLGSNTEYDLDAPVPAPGADTVDDFLFESQRGFCEQIASSLVVMLRSQGVPARLATGYIPGERDRVAGVWKVRARDAHAWVEVWFPVTGWQAFDPTASVPLAGETSRATIGEELAAAAWSALRSRALEIATAVAGVGLFIAAAGHVRTRRQRRRRGPWGRLHDRFVELADDAMTERGAPDPVDRNIDRCVGAPWTTRAAADAIVEQVGPDGGDQVRALADLFDRVAFDPSFEPTTSEFELAGRLLDHVERDVRRRVRTSSS